MKTKIIGKYTQYYTDAGQGLFDLRNGRIEGTGFVPNTSLKDIESYARQLLEAVEAAKLVINMNEKG